MLRRLVKTMTTAVTFMQLAVSGCMDDEPGSLAPARDLSVVFSDGVSTMCTGSRAVFVADTTETPPRGQLLFSSCDAVGGRISFAWSLSEEDAQQLASGTTLTEPTGQLGIEYPALDGRTTMRSVAGIRLAEGQLVIDLRDGALIEPNGELTRLEDTATATLSGDWDDYCWHEMRQELATTTVFGSCDTLLAAVFDF